MSGDKLPTRYRHRLEKFRYGPGVFKVDWALDGPIPWTAQECTRAATVHLGGTLEEIAASEREPWRGSVSEKPYVLLAQPSLFDPSRAPDGKQTAWAYCHVPNGSTLDMTERIEQQVERFAPGFRDRIIARSTLGPTELEAHNANLVGGDINGGAADLRQLFTRPVARRNPYTTPLPGVFICSASTPPGGGVHGMCGSHAALPRPAPPCLVRDVVELVLVPLGDVARAVNRVPVRVVAVLAVVGLVLREAREQLGRVRIVEVEAVRRPARVLLAGRVRVGDVAGHHVLGRWLSFRSDWSGEVEMKWKRRRELPWSRRTARLRIPYLSLHRSETDARVSILAASETQLSGNSRHTQVRERYTLTRDE